MAASLISGTLSLTGSLRASLRPPGFSLFLDLPQRSDRPLLNSLSRLFDSRLFTLSAPSLSLSLSLSPTDTYLFLLFLMSAFLSLPINQNHYHVSFAISFSRSACSHLSLSSISLSSLFDSRLFTLSAPSLSLSLSLSISLQTYVPFPSLLDVCISLSTYKSKSLPRIFCYFFLSICLFASLSIIHLSTSLPDA